MYWIKQPTQPYNVLLYIQKNSYTFYDIAFGQYVSHVELTCIFCFFLSVWHFSKVPILVHVALTE